MSNPVEQLDAAARELLDAKGFADKLRALAKACKVVRVWGDLRGRPGVATTLQLASKCLMSLARGVRPRAPRSDGS